jgi:hypothetical protein
MSTTGKVFAVLNVFGLVGLAALALMVYDKRQRWEYQNFLYDIVRDGLPVHSKQTDANGTELATRMTKQTQNTLFQNKNPVPTQVREVELVRDKVQKSINEAGDVNKQTARRAAVLLPLARDNAQRERLLSIQYYLGDENLTKQLKSDLEAAYAGAEADNKANQGKSVETAFSHRLTALRGEPRDPFAEAYLEVKKMDPAKKGDEAFAETVGAIEQQTKAQLDGEFKPVLDGQRGGKEMSLEERKEVIAFLLFNLLGADAPEPAGEKADSRGVSADAYKRYVTVVGLEAAARTINRQAVLLGEISQDLATQRDKEQHLFALALTPIVDEAKESARKAKNMELDVKRLNDKVKEQEGLARARKKDYDDAMEEWAKYKGETANKLALLRRQSDAVFNLRVRVRNVTASIQEDERRIRQLEGYRWLPFVGGAYLIRQEEP